MKSSYMQNIGVGIEQKLGGMCLTHEKLCACNPEITPVLLPHVGADSIMDTSAVSSSVPCEYDAQRGGFPLAVLEHLPPAELCCVACQRIARNEVAACKGPRASSPSLAHESPLSQAAIFLALLCLPC